MRSVLVLLTLLAGLACRGPQAEPIPAARLTIHFLDQDAVCGVDRPRPGVWAFMDAGLWRDLDTVWTGFEGRAVLGRTAPRWVLLKDPEGEVHRVVLSNEPDQLEPGQPSDRDSAEDQAEGLFITWLWLSQVFIRH